MGEETFLPKHLHVSHSTGTHIMCRRTQAESLWDNLYSSSNACCAQLCDGMSVLTNNGKIHVNTQRRFRMPVIMVNDPVLNALYKSHCPNRQTDGFYLPSL